MKKGIIMAGILSSFLGLFGFGDQVAKAYEPVDVYIGLRQQVLELNPSKIGLDPLSGNKVWAVLMETGDNDAVITLSAIADGTVSLYFSNGGGMIGLGEYEEVRNVSDDYIKSASSFLEYAELTDSFPLPSRGNTRFYFLTYSGIYAVEIKENDLGNNKSPLSPLFHKAHEVIGQARMAYEKRTMEAQQLISASAKGDIQEIKRLLDSGVSVDSADEMGLTPLMAAAYSGKDESVKVLLDANSEIEDRDAEGYTALIFASNLGKIDCAELLIAKGADVNAKANDGSTPIMFAAQHGYNEIVRLLLQKGADPSVKGDHGLSAIDFAVQNERKDTEKILIGG